MEVVDGEHERPLRGEVRDDPVEAVEHGEREVVLGAELALGHGQVEERGGEGSRPREQLRALLGRGRRERRLEQLPDDAVGELALELACSGGEHSGARVLGPAPCRRDQPRLADPGRPLDHRQPGRPGARGPDQCAHHGELRLPLEERRLAGRRRRGRGRERRVAFRQALDHELRHLETFEPVLAEMHEPQTFRHDSVDVEDRGARKQDLSAVADVANSRRRVHRAADVAAGRSGRLAGVQAHAHPDLGAAGPVVTGDRSLRRGHRRHCIPRLPKTPKNASPWRSDSIPPAASNVSRRRSCCPASSSAYRSSPTSRRSFAESSTSQKTKVAVPEEGAEAGFLDDVLLMGPPRKAQKIRRILPRPLGKRSSLLAGRCSSRPHHGHANRRTMESPGASPPSKISRRLGGAARRLAHRLRSPPA